MYASSIHSGKYKVTVWCRSSVHLSAMQKKNPHIGKTDAFASNCGGENPAWPAYVSAVLSECDIHSFDATEAAGDFVVCTAEES